VAGPIIAAIAKEFQFYKSISSSRVIISFTNKYIHVKATCHSNISVAKGFIFILTRATFISPSICVQLVYRFTAIFTYTGNGSLEISSNSVVESG
jgi:hypothetical protein